MMSNKIVGKSITIINSYRDRLNGRSGIVREIEGDIAIVQLVGAKMLTKFKLTDIR